MSNMKFNRKLGEQFCRIWCFPIQRDRRCTCMPRGLSKMSGEWNYFLKDLVYLWSGFTDRAWI